MKINLKILLLGTVFSYNCQLFSWKSFLVVDPGAIRITQKEDSWQATRFASRSGSISAGQSG